MRTTTVVLALVLTFPVIAAAQEFEEYVNTQDGFKIDFPGKPAVSTTTWTSQQSYKLPARVYSLDKGREHYSVTVVDYGGVEKMAIARSTTCVSGDRPLCRGTDV